jgi:hypothetical protein
MRWVHAEDDYEAANVILNHPAVLPYHFPGGMTVQELDLRGQRVVLEDGKACWLLIEWNGEMEVHTSVLPEWRHTSLKMAREFLDFVFNTTLVERITSYAPNTNKSAMRLASAAGMKRTSQDSQAAYYAITREEWEQLRCQQQSLY